MMKLPTITAVLLAAPIMAQQTTPPTSSVDERLAKLEQRVSDLEQKLTEKSKEAEIKKTQDNPEKTLKIIFADGFEKGTKLWKEEVRFSQIYPEFWKQKQKDAALKQDSVKLHDPWRSTKVLNAGDLRIEASEGKRFLTAASVQKGIANITSSNSSSTGTYKTWRGVRYLVMKDSISLAGQELPVAQFKAWIHIPKGADYKRQPYGAFRAGYITEKDSVAQFVPLMTITEDNGGWQDYEIDLSSAPKDKKLKIVFMSIMADSRIATSPGVQLDDIKVLDDAE